MHTLLILVTTLQLSLSPLSSTLLHAVFAVVFPSSYSICLFLTFLSSVLPFVHITAHTLFLSPLCLSFPVIYAHHPASIISSLKVLHHYSLCSLKQPLSLLRVNLSRVAIPSYHPQCSVHCDYIEMLTKLLCMYLSVNGCICVILRSCCSPCVFDNNARHSGDKRPLKHP